MVIDSLEQKRREKYKRIFRTALFVLWLLLFLTGIILTGFFFHTHGLKEAFKHLHFFLRTHEELLLITLFGLYMARAIIFIPVSLLGAFTGLLLSQQPVLAVTFATIATTLTSFLSFGIARSLGRKWVTEHETPRLKAFDRKVRERGFFTIFILRILIVVPFDLVNLASGFSAIRFRDYALASFLGIIPEVAVQVLLGNSVNHLISFKGSFFSPKIFLIGAIIVLAIYLVGRFLQKSPYFRDIWTGKESVEKGENRKKERKK